ncbi:50S ribosomal protein L3 [Candidatus Woesebacteria bacterium]|nr:50S ribosomal protein L3 [Candidatus Woesebacteria bacterium]QQG47781.1 MAG: 50S ribosomal protein L3 [Candidatus Woesebacteria bacterium]
MINTILAEKGKMSQAFVEGARTPVTKLKADPCVVTQIKTLDKDGYWAIQLGSGTKKIKNTTKPLLGHFKKILQKDQKTAPHNLREVKLSEEPAFKVGDLLSASDVLKVGDFVAVTAVSKGKGFAGVVKRHHFAGGPKTHGQSDRLRAPGSIGQGTTPGRVYKGKRMAGRMGNVTITTKNLQIVKIDKSSNQLEIKGTIPGRVGTLVRITKI